MDAGLLVVRLVFGLSIAAHGSQKLFGWFGGYGLTAVSAMFDSLGFRPGRLFATVASLAELVGGALIVLGFFGPIGPALMVSVMIVAALSVHWRNGFFATSNGIELPLLYASAGAALALTGPGRVSLDTLLGLTNLWTPEVASIVLGVAIVGGIATLIVRRVPALAA